MQNDKESATFVRLVPILDSVSFSPSPRSINDTFHTRMASPLGIRPRGLFVLTLLFVFSAIDTSVGQLLSCYVW